ncbi:hypothetical protein M0M57_09250 [Flavobacterium azooxidireducens]|uniref:Uncharacterized protein n=1 Tax=Flavobacterium azooxidireducens TaxID=1871076 RepID=A0ABY4KBV5_9FLAO|nr:hypothetical protein [Flavobacterium azooxidireducens]UPQ77816.1 hypothetical protein M0M57_09250 [Flavobacterium azooxidireducens]
MQHNHLEQKIAKINSVTPKLDDFLQNGFDINYAQAFISDYILEYKKQCNETEVELFELFKLNVQYKRFSIIGNIMLTEIEEYEDFYKIGHHESDLIILIKSTEEIAILDHEDFEIREFISENFEVFLDLIPILISYDKLGYLGKEYTTDIKNKTLEEVKKILKSEKYYSFFSYSLMGE